MAHRTPRFALALLLAAAIPLERLAAQFDLSILPIIYRPYETIAEPNLGMPGIEDNGVFDLAPDPPPPAGPAGELRRAVYFVHGLTGSEASWSNAAAYVDRHYAVEAETPDWSGYQISPLETAANRLEQDMDLPRGVDEDRAFVVAHSMGGIAAREISRQYAEDGTPEARRKFHGLVTVATPHGGARVVNALDEAKAVVADGCASVAAAEAEELFDENFRLRWLLNFTGADALIGEVTETLCGPVLEDVFDFLIVDKFINRSALDIAEGTAFMNRLAVHDVALPSVNVIATEDAPAFWKLATNLMTAPNEFEPFAAREDEALEQFAEENATRYAAKRDHHVTRRNYYQRAWPIDWGRAAAHDAAHVAYARGWRFFDSANLQWLSVIGAVRYENVYDGYDCSCSDGRRYDVATAYECYAKGSCAATAKVVDTRTIIEPSDGVVREAQQRAWGAEDNYTITNNNHLQVRNSPEIGEFFERTLLRGDGVNPFFITELD